MFHDHIEHFKVVKILYFACVFSSPLSTGSLFGKKNSEEGEGKGGGGGGRGLFLLPSSTLDQRFTG